MSISQGQRAVRKYASQFETLLGRLDSHDEGLMLNQFIWGLQPELARSVSLHYPKSIAQAISLAETTELAVWHPEDLVGNQVQPAAKRQGPKDNKIGAEAKVDTEVEVEMLLAVGEETHGFQAEAEEGILE